MTCWCQIAYLLGTSRKAINRASLTQIRVHHHCNCFPTVVYDSRNRSKNLNGDKRTRSGKYLHFHISGAFGNGDSGLTLGDTVRISSRFWQSICLKMIGTMMIGPSKIRLAVWSSTGSITTTWNTCTCLLSMSSLERGIHQRQNRFRLFFLWDEYTLWVQEEDDQPPIPSKSPVMPPKWLSPWFMTTFEIVNSSRFRRFGELI